MSEKQFNCIELFAGAGGLGTGFEKAGFNIISANDIWEPAKKTYVANHKNVNYIVKDIALLKSEELLANTSYTKQDIDVIIGGPPCQGFSTLGKRFIDDPRNKLFKEYVRIVNDIRPKFFVMENVAGILSMENGNVLKNILKSFTEIGYIVKYKLLNAAEYGVPQLRKWVIFIGTKLNGNIEYPEKTHSLDTNFKYKKALTIWDAISDLPQSDDKDYDTYTNEPQNEYQTLIRNNCVKLTNHKPTIYNNKTQIMMKYIPMGKSVWDIKENIPKEYLPTSGYGNTYARLNANEPCMTITRNFSCVFLLPDAFTLI